jgi:predicted esterase
MTLSRSFYSYAIFFATLAIAVMLSENTMYVLIGARVTELSAARGWMLTSFGVIAIHSLILIRYYKFKHYQFALWATASVIITLFLQTIMIANVLQTREVTPLYVVLTLLVGIASVIVSLSLLFSTARERKWLRVAGFCSLLTGLAWLFSIGWSLLSVSDRVGGATQKLDQVVGFFNCLIPVFFILNYKSERSMSRDRRRDESIDTLYAIGSFVVIMVVTIFGYRFMSEGLWRYSHPDYVWTGAKTLASQFDEGAYVSNHNTLRYRLLSPMNYDSSKRYPIVVCLHGSSGCGNDNVKQIAACIPAAWLSNYENRIKYPAFLLVPQCPEGKTWGGLGDIPAVDGLVIEAMRDLEKKFPIDTTRRYISGNSLGGYGTWHLTARYPDMFAAAIPIAGGGDPALANQLKNIPIWAFHGTDDVNVPVSRSRDVVEAIKNAGGHPVYTEIPGKAHNIEKDVLATPGLLDWLFSQKKL